jgi:hypothetical protein
MLENIIKSFETTLGCSAKAYGKKYYFNYHATKNICVEVTGENALKLTANKPGATSEITLALKNAELPCNWSSRLTATTQWGVK